MIQIMVYPSRRREYCGMRACFIYNQASTFHCFCTILPTAPCRFHWLLFVSHTSMPATLGSLEVHPTNSKVSNFNFVFFQGIVFQSLSRVWLFVTPWTAAHQASLSFTLSSSLLRLMSIESVMPSNHLILCCLLHFLPSMFPSIRVFSNELALPIRQPKYWSFSFSPSSEYSGLIYFRSHWFDLLIVQGALKSLDQHYNSKAYQDICSE